MKLCCPGFQRGRICNENETLPIARISGLREQEGQIKIVDLQRVLDALIKTSERATRLQATGEGSAKGPKPKWLDASVDFTITGLEAGSTVLGIEAPLLGETAYEEFAYEEFAQQEFWRDQPRLDDTALDLAAYAIQEAGDVDSAGDRFDSGVLDRRFSKFRKAVRASGIRYELTSEGSAPGDLHWMRRFAHGFNERLKKIPAPKAFIVSGRLDEIKHGGGRFRLLLDSDSQLLGRLRPDSLDAEVLRPLWGKPTTVEGMVHFKASGQPRLIEAYRMSVCAEGDDVFKEMPSVEKAEKQSLVVAQVERVRSADPLELVGAWPGDEPIDELLAQLD